jgi:hypothetical protein
LRTCGHQGTIYGEDANTVITRGDSMTAETTESTRLDEVTDHLGEQIAQRAKQLAPWRFEYHRQDDVRHGRPLNESDFAVRAAVMVAYAKALSVNKDAWMTTGDYRPRRLPRERIVTLNPELTARMHEVIAHAGDQLVRRAKQLAIECFARATESAALGATEDDFYVRCAVMRAYLDAVHELLGSHWEMGGDLELVRSSQ